MAIARPCGPVIGKRQLKQAVTEAAAGIDAFYAAQAPRAVHRLDAAGDLR